jgi:nitronate monooxygenase
MKQAPFTDSVVGKSVAEGASALRFPFPLRVPAVCAPMFLVSGPQLVIAACQAGVLGAFPNNNVRTTEEYGEWLRTISEALWDSGEHRWAHPWAANLITHSTNTRLSGDLEMIAKYKPPVVITALGSPRPAIEVVHSYGGLVLADVVSLKLARKAADAGVDGLVCVCSGAGGHTGHLSPFAFVSAVRSFFDGLIFAGGGIADGWGILGALAAGADLAYMGTRFIAAEESLASDGHKNMVVASSVDDLLVSAAITGTPASWLKPSLLAAGLDPDDMPATPDRIYDSARSKDVRRWKDIWGAGQGLGAVRAIEPVRIIVDRLVEEYGQAMHRVSYMRAGTMTSHRGAAGASC